MDIAKIMKQWLDEGDEETGPFEPSIILCALAELLEDRAKECKFEDIALVLGEVAEAVRRAEYVARDSDL